MLTYKLSALAAIDLSYQTAFGALKTPVLAGVAKAFIDNVDRALSMCVFLGRLLDLTDSLNEMPLQAKTKALGDALAGGVFHEESYRTILRFVEDIVPMDLRALERLEGRGEGKRRKWEEDLTTIDAMVRISSGFLSKGVESMLSSMVVGTWTAFETLAGDLWVKAVNAQPTYLASLTGTENRINRLVHDNSPARQKSEKEEEKSQSVEDDEASEPLSKTAVTLGAMSKITGGKYDLSDRMGTLLVEAKRVQFTSLEGVREAYSMAFSEKVKRARTQHIDAALADKNLNALSAVRNLIVHKAGKADAVYKDDCKTAPNAPPLKEGDVLQLDGEICRILIEPAVKASVELVKAVDVWLTLTRR